MAGPQGAPAAGWLCDVVPHWPLSDRGEVHVHPEADLVTHVLRGSTCPCGPRTETCHTPGCPCPGVLYMHASLDGRELDDGVMKEM